MPWHGKSSPPARVRARGIPADAGFLHRIRRGLRRRAVAAASRGDGLFDRREGRAQSRRDPCRSLPRADRPAGIGPCRALLRHRLAASCRCPRRRSVRRHRFGARRPRCAGESIAGKPSGTTCRAVRASSKAISISTRSMATYGSASPRSMPARCPLVPADRGVRLFVLAGRDRGGRRAGAGGAVHDHAGAWAFPHERGSGTLSPAPAAGSSGNRRHLRKCRLNCSESAVIVGPQFGETILART